MRNRLRHCPPPLLLLLLLMNAIFSFGGLTAASASSVSAEELTSVRRPISPVPSAASNQAVDSEHWYDRELAHPGLAATQSVPVLGEIYQIYLQLASVRAIDQSKWLVGDKAEWRELGDVKKHSWGSTSVSSSSQLNIRPAIYLTALPSYLHEAGAALTGGSKNDAWYALTWLLPEKPRWMKRGMYRTAYNLESGVIITTFKDDPKVIAAGNALISEDDPTWRDEDDWPDITFLTYKTLSANQQKTKAGTHLSINSIVFVIDPKSETQKLVKPASPEQWEAVSTFERATSFTPQTSEHSYNTLLGSAEGQSVAMLLLRRRAELGHLEVGEIRFWVAEGQACLLFSIVEGSPQMRAESQELHAPQPVPDEGDGA